MPSRWLIYPVGRRFQRLLEVDCEELAGSKVQIEGRQVAVEMDVQFTVLSERSLPISSLSSRTTDILCCPTDALVRFEPPLLLLQGKLLSFTRDTAIPAGHIYLPSFVRSFLNVEEGEGATVRGRWDWSSGIMDVPSESVHLTVRYARLYKEDSDDRVHLDELSIRLVDEFSKRVLHLDQSFRPLGVPFVFTVTRIEPLGEARARTSPLTFGVMCHRFTLESEEDERLRLKNEATVSMPGPVHSAPSASLSLSRPPSPPLLHPVDSFPPPLTDGASVAELHARNAELQSCLRRAHQRLREQEEAYASCRVCFEPYNESSGRCRVRIGDCGHAVVCAACVERLDDCPVCRRGVFGSSETYI